MRYLKTLSIISAMSAIAMAPAAFAGDTNTASEAEMAKTENTQVLAAVATADMIPVQDEDGNIYYNHYVSDAELITITTASLSLMVLTACTTTGNTERGAIIGAASGAVIGAVIGNNTGSGDASTGATIGAVVGGAGGAYAGSQKDRTVGEPTRIRQSAQGQELIYDRQAGRYYFTDRNTGRTYWQDGSIRSY